MPTYRLFVTTNETGAGQALDRLAAHFEEEGYPAATTEIDEDNGIWQASLYLEHEPDEALRAAMAEALAGAFPREAIETETLPDIDWVSHSLAGLKPVRAGRFIVHGAHDRAAVQPHDIAIQIDAAQAFGTGHHGTTAGCLEMLDEVIRAWPARRGYPARILDLGTGSGVLAIAAARLVPARVLATDIDPVATAVARDNMRINQVMSRVTTLTAGGLNDPKITRAAPFDLIIANILARPLMTLAPKIAAARAPGGAVILSGILATQRWKVLAAYQAQGLYHVRTLWRDGWVTLLLR
ncbi:50S ribosomal protein L11 methyltransferase [Pseudohoeflea coraliihabitans]|uniref:Ribosomal protein L11 methyltransferase n=1 Tax=Pseudohoeflea coraliihabitans TaxID=2860393 RepID=A0ABS6WIY7_9HYPH|nr:50S ribosomal protein L11 methyltransferase [Pseudohoeflea sp. DP4N28-3]MBW3095903.1 50S ribosomal protein L11 methyltransferase [Pseudohoeflea sp. DP4N28-3]